MEEQGIDEGVDEEVEFDRATATTGGLLFFTAAEVAELLRLNHQVVQRKLQKGEIPGYRIGREWRVERSELLQWLHRHSNRRFADPDDRVLDQFIDERGRLTALPSKRSTREIVLRRLAAEFTPDRTYREREVNEVLRRFHDDVATIRRELVSARHLTRTTDGIYKRTGPREPALRGP